MYRFFTLLSFFYCVHFNVQAQTSNFSFSDSVCLNSDIALVNESLDAVRYEWDFCQKALSNAPVVSHFTTVADAILPMDIEVVYDSGSWHGFMASRTDHKLFHLKFGSSLDTVQSIIDLGNVGSLLNGPHSIKLRKEGSTWYGLLINFGNSRLIRLTFTNGLDSAPTATNLGNLSSWNETFGLTFAEDDNNVIAAVTSRFNQKITLLNFGNSLANTPSGGNILDLTVPASVTQPVGIHFVNDENKWYGLLSSQNNGKVFRLDFGDNLFSNPTFNEVASATNPFDLSFVREGTDFYGFVFTSTGNLIRLSFGDTLSNNSPTYINFGTVLSNSNGFTLVDYYPGWKAFGVDFNTKKIHSYEFSDNCSEVSINTSTADNPINVNFNTSGQYAISLIAYDLHDNRHDTTKFITILNQTAPSVSFTTDNACIDNQNTFTGSSSDDPGVTSWDWDFGDGNMASGQIVNHQYISTGNYLVTLSITTSNCENQFSDSVAIYDSPISSFDLPLANLCTNNALNFTNTSNVLSSDSAVFTWNFNGEGTSVTTDGTFTFSTPGTKDILLVSEITGCIDSLTQQISLAAGPATSFSWTNNCFGDSIQFVNESETNDVVYQWDFGDGSPMSNLKDPKHLYNTSGNYNVMLSVEDTINGCTTEITESLDVNENPLTSFTYNAPITENFETQFFGDDLTLTGDSIVQWNWDFGGLASSNDQDALITFSSPDTLTVNLSITTAQGCTENVDDTVIISDALQPTVNFTVLSDTLCLSENLNLTNSTVNAVRYEWDFCHEALESTPVSELMTTIGDAAQPMDMEIVYDEGGWHGFLPSRSDNKLFYLDFGSALDDVENVTDFGNIGGLLNGPHSLKMIKEGSIWYGLLINFSNSRLIRLTFNDGLSSTPTAENLGNLSTWSSTFGLALKKDGDDIIASVTSRANNKITMLNFGNSITNTISGGDILDLTVPASVSGPVGIDFVNDGDEWFGLLNSQTNGKVFKLDFGSSLFSDPVFNEVSTATNPFDISFVQEGANFHGIVFTTAGNMIRLSFGDTLNHNSPVATNFGTVLGTSNGFTLVQDFLGWKAYGIDYTSKNIYRYDFTDLCSNVSINTSSEMSPENISYSEPGSYLVRLIAYDENDGRAETNKMITILNQQALGLAFTTNNLCITNENIFNGNSDDDSSVLQWEWDFGDNSTASGQNVNHQYASVGTYPVSLQIESSNGCSNNFKQTITIYSEPAPSFDMSPGLLCSNSSVVFDNTTPGEFGNDISWEWQVDGGTVSTEEDLDVTFLNGGNIEVKLIASIPGCSVEYMQNVFIEEGAIPAFSFDDSCIGALIQFTNESTGNVVSQEWDFGNGFTSILENPPFEYPDPGSYTVRLTVTNAAGCVTFSENNLTVYSLPVVQFSNELACSGSLTEFTDMSVVSNANIESWLWNFDDPASGANTSTDQNPDHVFSSSGEFDVKLIATSTFGCKDSLEQTISVLPEPNAAFTYDKACIGETMQFQDISSPVAGEQITSWAWDLGGTFSTGQNPSETFEFAIDYNVSLTVTSENLCTNTTTQTISIHDIPAIEFGVDNTCEDDQTQLFDLTETQGDPIVQYNWDFAGLGNSSDSSTTFLFENAGDYEVSLTVMTQQGCEYSSSKSITINQTPQAQFTPSLTFGAPPLVVEFQNNSPAAQTFSWDFGDSNTSSDSNPTNTFTTEGEYDVQLIITDENECKDTTSQIINVLQPVLDVELSQINIINNEIILTLVNNGTIQLDSLKALIQLGDDIELEETIRMSMPPTINPEPINYKLDLKISNNNLKFLCVDISSFVTQIEETDIDNNNECVGFQSDVTILNPRPNPVRDNLNFSVISDVTGIIHLEIMDSRGTSVKSLDWTAIQGRNDISVYMGDLKNGIYLVKIQMGGSSIIRRISVDK